MTAPHIQALVEAVRELEKAENDYRVTHDLRGDGDRETGRRWDCMRRVGDKTRNALAAFEAAEKARIERQPAPASNVQLEAAKDVIAFVGPGLLVLRNMLHVAKLPLGEEKAKEMIKAVQDFLAADFPTPAPPSPADGEYDYDLALMLWPFVNAKELSEDKFAKVARKSFAAFTRDNHRSCMAAWKVYCENRRNTAPPKRELVHSRRP